MNGVSRVSFVVCLVLFVCATLLATYELNVLTLTLALVCAAGATSYPLPLCTLRRATLKSIAKPAIVSVPPILGIVINSGVSRNHDELSSGFSGASKSASEQVHQTPVTQPLIGQKDERQQRAQDQRCGADKVRCSCEQNCGAEQNIDPRVVIRKPSCHTRPFPLWRASADLVLQPNM